MQSRPQRSDAIVGLLPAIRVTFERERCIREAAEAENAAALRRVLDRRRSILSEDLRHAIDAAYREEARYRARDGDDHAAELARTLSSLLERRCRVLRQRVDALLEREPPFPRETDPVAVNLGFFDACRLSRNEVVQTRMLAYFLDPRGSHGLGSRPLRAFVCLLRACPESPPNWLNDDLGLDGLGVRARAEFPLTGSARDQDRRLDVVVAAGGRRIVVEAKIAAGESASQLADIEFGAAIDAALVFLTVNGDEPTTATNPRRWIRLRWQDVAAAFGAALRDSDGPGVDLARLWCGGMLHEIARLQSLDAIRTGWDSHQLTRLENYLSTWRAIADGLDS